MSVHLVGGGRDLDAAVACYGQFVAECGRRAEAAEHPVPRVAVVVVAEADELDAGVDWFAQALRRCSPVEVVALTATSGAGLVLDGGVAPTEGWWSDLDGLLVGGGVTPDYHRALQPHGGAVRAAVADGLPYAGFSAGAMIAPVRALLGGWRLGELAVTHEDNGEDLDPVTVTDGLGLIGSTVEVHTAQWGTLSRLVAAVDAGEVAEGIAVDENTVVILATGTDSSSPATGTTATASARVAGAGQAWFVAAVDGRVEVTRRPAGR
jgi:cyanophycinase